MARTPRHKHHSRKARSNWAFAGAFVASTAFVPSMITPLQARDLSRRLESLRIVVPGETRLARAAQTAPGANPRPLTFDVPAGPLRTVLAEIERASGITITITDPAIGDISSAGVSGTLTAEQAVARVIEGTSVTSRVTGPANISLEIRLASEAVDVAGSIPVAQPSSPRYSAPLRDVPQTIEIIPREVMEAQGATTLSDALRNVPGISLQAGEGGGASSTTGDMFNLRGFSANNSLFVDGVRDDGLMSRDVYNLEQVEVFMGPTGSDVGRGNAAGYVNMQTKVPLPDAAHVVNYGFGSGGINRMTLDLNQPLSADKDGWMSRSSIRFNALWEGGGVSGRDEADRSNKSIAPSIALGLGTPTRVSVAGQVTRQDNLPDYGVPGAAWQEDLLAPTTVHAVQPVDQTNFFGSVNYDYDRVEQENYTARIEHDLNSNTTLRNQTRYNNTHREAVISTVQNPAAFNADTQAVTVARQGNERENDILSNQTNLSSRFATGRLRHAANFGLELASEEQFAPTLGGFGTRVTPQSIYAPNPFDEVSGYAPARTAAWNRGKTSTVAVYAFDTFEIGRVQLNAGLRWERYETSVNVVDATGAVTTDLTESDGLFSGKAGLLFRLTNNANAYVSYGSSVTPPGTANFTLSAQPGNQNNPNVDPQRSKNYEVGTKVGLFDDKLSLSAAVFRTVNENVIFVVDGTAIPPIYNQDDGQLVKGFTLGALGQVNPRWQILASLGYLDTSLESQNAATNGNRLTLTPEWSGSLWTTYDFPSNLTLGLGLRYMDNVFVNAANTIIVPNYALMDAMAEYDISSHLSLRLNVINLTDQVYVRNVNNNGGRYNPGTPRSATLTSSIRF